MRFTMYLAEEDKSKLEYEVIPRDLRIHLTRLLDRRIDEARIHNMNRVVNQSRMLAGLPPYVLRSDGYGDYQGAELTWHEGELQVVFLRLNTIEFVEYLCGLVEDEWLYADEVNQMLQKDGRSFWLRESRSEVEVEVSSLSEIEEDNESGHPNVRKLIQRMDRSLKAGDFAAVIHSSASIFETMAKDVIGIESIQNESLGSFFQRYRKDSNLPEAVLDYVEDIYDSRNMTPLAGHGSLEDPDIDETQATTLVNMTKAFVRIEYRFFLQDPSAQTNGV